MSDRIFRVVGPPGCGKTTYIARQARIAAEKFGPERVFVASLTKAAAAAAAGKDTGLPRDRIGTLHSHCYHALEKPELIGKNHVSEWNELHPDLALSGDAVTTEKGEALGLGDGDRPGDAVLMSVEMMRSQMVDIPGDTVERRFSDEWTAYKAGVGAMDFTDLIETALREVPAAPGRPAVILLDEVQDFSRLEMALIEKWTAADGVDSTVLTGDPYQALYSWRGASPDVLAGRIDKILPVVTKDNPEARSYRVPRAVHERALEIIKRASTYDDRLQYMPRDEDGEFVRSGATWRQPEPLLREVESGEPVMILASCDFQLQPVKAMLRDRGIPYHNPYTHRWNPIGSKRADTARSLLALCAEDFGGERDAAMFSVEELLRIDSVIYSKLLWRGNGAAAALKALEKGLPPDRVRAFVSEWMTPDAQAALGGGDLAWIEHAMTKAGASRMAFPLRVVRTRGLPAIASEPSVIIGTIHSVKGGQCDTVAVFPDLSPAAMKQSNQPGWYGRDAILRQFYVAATRARRRLIACSPAWPHYVRI